MKTHYQALGINEDADDEVIVAAYKALAKKYHPDTYAGDKKFAEERMKEINIAYGVLSDKAKRKKYDEEIKSKKGSNEFNDEDEFDDDDIGVDQLKEDWEIVKEVYPEAEFCREYLFKISPSLSFNYQLVLLTTKGFEHYEKLTEEIKEDFLERYFGNDKKVKHFAQRCLMAKNRKIAKEINKKISLLGTASSDRVLEEIKKKYQLDLSKIDFVTSLRVSDYISSKIRENNNKKANHNSKQNSQYDEYRGYRYLSRDGIFFLISQPEFDTGPSVKGLEYSNLKQLKFYVDMRLKEEEN